MSVTAAAEREKERSNRKETLRFITVLSSSKKRFQKANGPKQAAEATGNTELFKLHKTPGLKIITR